MPVTQVPMLDLKAQFAAIKEEVMAQVNQVFENQAFILGPKVAEAEEALADYLKVPHALGVSSGTDALLLSLMALGVGPGDGVITTPFTFFATAGSIARLGAVPLFADIDPDTYNLDHQKVAELLADPNPPAKPACLLPVHLFGQAAEMAPLMDLAESHNLAVVEDAAQAIGAVYPAPDGSLGRIGSMGETGCFSFFPSKNLGGAGDGGLITCKDDDLAAKLRSMRTHGSHPKEKYRHIHLGGNFRLDALQAAVILAKLPHLDDWTKARRENAALYNELFTANNLVTEGLISLPKRAWERADSHVFNQYVIRAKDRDQLMARLSSEKIGHAVYYPTPLHLLECFSDLGYQEGDFPEAEKASQEVLALPVYPELTQEQQEHVVEVVTRYYY